VPFFLNLKKSWKVYGLLLIALFSLKEARHWWLMPVILATSSIELHQPSNYEDFLRIPLSQQL
jgi:hypothetical protein